MKSLPLHERKKGTVNTRRYAFLCAGIAALAPAALGCNSNHMPAPMRVSPERRAGMAEILGADAGEFASTVDPVAPAGDLKAELDAFTSLNACVETRARLDPLVGEAIEAIGYDTFLLDACRLLEAAKARDSTLCEAIDASALRERCQATVAEVAATAELCPWAIAGRPSQGHDATCLAIASRDARLCAGVEHAPARATCEAIAMHDRTRCASLKIRSEVGRCERAADRFRAIIAPSDTAARPDEMPRVIGRLRVDSAEAPSFLDVDLTTETDIARGVVVRDQRDGAHFVVGPLTDSGLDFVAASPHVRPSLALELFQPAATAGKDPDEIRIERAELIVPGHAPLATPIAHSTLTAKLSKFTHARGAPVQFSIVGTLGDAAETLRVRAEVSTFVRDIVAGSGVTAGSRSPPTRPLDPLARRSALDGSGSAP